MSEPKGKLEMTKQRSPRRSPAQILADLQAKMASVSVRAAKSNPNPHIQRLQGALADLNGMLATQQRGFSKGPQSFDERIASHHRWIVEISKARDLASASIACLQGRKIALQRRIESIAKDIASGLGVSDAEIDEIVRVAFHLSSEVVSAQEDFHEAQALRKGVQENEAGA